MRQIKILFYNIPLTILVLNLQSGVWSLPQPFPVVNAVQIFIRRNIISKAEEIQREAILSDVLDGQQLHTQLVLIQLQAFL